MRWMFTPKRPPVKLATASSPSLIGSTFCFVRSVWKPTTGCGSGRRASALAPAGGLVARRPAAGHRHYAQPGGCGEQRGQNQREHPAVRSLVPAGEDDRGNGRQSWCRASSNFDSGLGERAARIQSGRPTDSARCSGRPERAGRRAAAVHFRSGVSGSGGVQRFVVQRNRLRLVAL